MIEEYLHGLNWKVLAGMLIGIFFLILLFLFLPTSWPTTQPTVSPNTIPTQESGQPIHSGQSFAWATFQTQWYSLKYPSNWNIDPVQFPGKSNSVYFMSPYDAALKKYNTITVVVSSDPGYSPQAKTALYKSVGLTQSTDTIAAISAIKFDGKALVGSPGSTARESTYSHIYLFEKNNVYYEIRCQYRGDTQVASFDTVCHAVIASVTLP